MSRLIGILSSLLGLGLLLAAGWWLYQGPEEAAPEEGRPPYVLPVTLTTVERGDLAPVVDLTGSVRSLARAQLAFETDGVIEELSLREAESMGAQQPLARLRNRDANLRLAATRADLSLAETELAMLRAGVREEERMRLAAVQREAAAGAQLAAAEIERQRKLFADNIVSQADLDRTLAQHEAAVARAEATAESVRAAEAGTRKEDIAIAEARVEVRLASVAEAQEQVRRSELLAPFEGVVLRRLVSVGDFVTRGQPVYEVVDLQQLEVVVEIPSRYAAAVTGKPQVVMTLDEMPDLEIVTQMDAKVPAADERSRNFRGLIRLEAGEAGSDQLRPGMFVRVAVRLRPSAGALLVPADAVRITDLGPVVVSAKEAEGGLSAEWVPVRVLATDGSTSAVQALDGSPLEAGSQVVLTGVDLAFPGAPLLPSSSPADAPAEEAAQ